MIPSWIQRRGPGAKDAFPRVLRQRSGTCFVLLLLAVLTWEGAAMATDWRNARSGRRIPSRNYADQPYVVIRPDGAWVCTLTTGAGKEGQRGQHIAATISRDRGQTWSDLIPIEPPDGPEASWAVPYIDRNGRIYVFYTYNGDRVHLGRDDTHGWYCMRWSDDGGRSWNPRRIRLPMRITACDRDNGFNGRVQMFWGICKPIDVPGEGVAFSFTKLHRYFLMDGEGWMFRSRNLATCSSPNEVRWDMLPDGDHGIRNPAFGSVQEEHNIAWLKDDDLICIYRTALGFPAVSYSDDGGRSWSLPEPMRYAPGKRIIRNPRACPRIWRCRNGRFLFWFHNNACGGFGLSPEEKSRSPMRGNLPDNRGPSSRNPVWICGGVLKGGRIHWSEPEILLYDPDPEIRMSYPDLIEDHGDHGRFYVTETNKHTARVHEIDRDLLENMWKEVEEAPAGIIRNGLLFEEVREADASQVRQPVLPTLPDLARGGGFTIECTLDSPREIPAGCRIIESHGDGGQTLAIETAQNSAVRILLCDGRHTVRWDSDPGVLPPGRLHHLAFVVDGAAAVLSTMVDGKVCDGGGKRLFGWTLFRRDLGVVHVGGPLTISPPAGARVNIVRIYNRALHAWEVVANYRSTGTPDG